MADNFYASYPVSSGGSGGAVTSVNSMTGAVVLTASDVGAANTTLSNLDTPTAINQNLLFATDATNDIGAAMANRPQHVFVSDYVSVGNYPFGSSMPGAALVNGAAPGLHFYNGGPDQYDIVASAASGVSIENFGASVAIFNVQNDRFAFEDKSNPTAGDFYFQGNSTTGMTTGRNLTLNGLKSDGTSSKMIGIAGDDTVQVGAAGTTPSINVTNGYMLSTLGDQSVLWENRQLWIAGNSSPVLDWGVQSLNNPADGSPALTWATSVDIKTADQPVASSYQASMVTGNAIGDQSNTGQIIVSTGDATAGNSGNINVTTGQTADSTIGPNVSGSIQIGTGNDTGTGNSGNITISTGSTTSPLQQGDLNLSGREVFIQAPLIGGITIEADNDPSQVVTVSAGKNIFLIAPYVFMAQGASDPTVTDGPGAMYYNTTINKLKLWNGTTWETVTSV